MVLMKKSGEGYNMNIERHSMQKIDLRKLQFLQLEALKEIHRICEKYGTNYCMIGGTLMGAVKHKGFIPWDDDIDIAMLRTDYDRFLSCYPAEQSEKYFLQNYWTDIDFHPPLTRLCIKGTYVDDQLTKHLSFNKRAYIEIFPIDNIPDDDKLQNKQRNKLRMIDTLMRFKACLIYQKGPFLTKLIAKKIFKVMLLPISLKFLQRRREKVMKEYSKQTTSRVCSTVSKYMYRQVMKRSVYEKRVLLEFEGGWYSAPQQWDAYLKQIYGDYMTLPTEEMRKPSFDVYEA